MKLKTVHVNGKTYAEVKDGQPVFVHDDGRHAPFDVPGALAQISNMTKQMANIDAENLMNAFANSRFIRENITQPADMIHATFGRRFKREDGRLVGLEMTGSPMMSKTRPGYPADFDEALERMINAYPHREAILKSSSSSGAESGHRTGGAIPGPNPFDTKTQNLTVAQELIKTNPGRARTLAKQAGFSPINW